MHETDDPNVTGPAQGRGTAGHGAHPTGRAASGPVVRAALTAALGAGLAAAYAHFVGCGTGTCPLTSSVWTAALYGAAVGGIAGWPSRARAERSGL